MDQNEYTDTLVAGEHQFLVKTLFDREKREIISSVSENEHVLDTYQYSLQDDSQLEDLPALAEKKHRAVLNDWELLFYIHGKVINADHAQSANKLGLILRKRNLLPEAIDCFSSAIMQDDYFTDAYINLGKTYLQAEIYDEAEAVLSRAEEISPEYPDLLYYLGTAYLKKQAFQQAVDKLENALQINPQYDAAHFMLALGYLSSIVMQVGSTEMIPRSHRKKKILAHLQKAMDLNHFYNNPNIRQAMKEIQDENYDHAASLLDEVDLESASEKENHLEDEFYLKFMFGGKSKDDDMISNYIRQLQMRTEEKPNYPDLHNNLGIAYLIQCRNMFLKAMEQFRAALKINPHYKNAKKNLKLAQNEGKGFIILLRALLK